MTWAGDLDWTEVTVGIEVGVVALFRVMVKGELGIREPGALKSVGLGDKGARLTASNKDKKSLLPAMAVWSMFGREMVLPSGSP